MKSNTTIEIVEYWRALFDKDGMPKDPESQAEAFVEADKKWIYLDDVEKMLQLFEYHKKDSLSVQNLCNSFRSHLDNKPTESSKRLIKKIYG